MPYVKRFQFSLLSQSIHTSDFPSTSNFTHFTQLWWLYNYIMNFCFKNNLFSSVILLFLTCLQNGSNFCVMKFLNAKFGSLLIWMSRLQGEKEFSKNLPCVFDFCWWIFFTIVHRYSTSTFQLNISHCVLTSITVLMAGPAGPRHEVRKYVCYYYFFILKFKKKNAGQSKWTVVTGALF